MTPHKLAEAIKAAVDQLCQHWKPIISPGARIEEICGFPLRAYPDEVMPLELLPTIDGFKFIGWTADFAPVVMEQAAVAIGDNGPTRCIQVAIEGNEDPDYIVAWKPYRRDPLAVRIGPGQ